MRCPGHDLSAAVLGSDTGSLSNETFRNESLSVLRTKFDSRSVDSSTSNGQGAPGAQSNHLPLVPDSTQLVGGPNASNASAAAAAAAAVAGSCSSTAGNLSAAISSLGLRLNQSQLNAYTGSPLFHMGLPGDSSNLSMILAGTTTPTASQSLLPSSLAMPDSLWLTNTTSANGTAAVPINTLTGSMLNTLSYPFILNSAQPTLYKHPSSTFPRF